MLQYKPHSALVKTASQRESGDDIEGVAYAADVTVRGQLTPGNAKLIYDQHNITLDSPMLWMTDLEDAPKFTPGTVVVVGAVNYIVKVIEEWSAIPSASFASVILVKEKV